MVLCVYVSDVSHRAGLRISSGLRNRVRLRIRAPVRVITGLSIRIRIRIRAPLGVRTGLSVRAPLGVRTGLRVRAPVGVKTGLRVRVRISIRKDSGSGLQKDSGSVHHWGSEQGSGPGQESEFLRSCGILDGWWRTLTA